MRHYLKGVLLHLTRTLSLVMLAALGTVALMRLSPGYFTDVRELDPEYANAARAKLNTEQQQGSIKMQSLGLLQGWLHGDLGRSRQFDIPTSELIGPRIVVTGKLLLHAVGSGWLVATLLSVPLGLRRSLKGEPIMIAITVVMLAIPVGAMATACLLVEHGGPVTVLATLVAVRDFKLLYRLIRQTRMCPHLTYARALGLTSPRITFIHLLPAISRELLAIGVVSLTTALSAIIPVEVVFDVPGLGQLAWSAAMNRDLPVLLGVTLIMATAFGLLTTAAESHLREVTV